VVVLTLAVGTVVALSFFYQTLSEDDGAVSALVPYFTTEQHLSVLRTRLTLSVRCYVCWAFRCTSIRCFHCCLRPLRRRMW
jgi:hypothetical protein